LEPEGGKKPRRGREGWLLVVLIAVVLALGMVAAFLYGLPGQLMRLLGIG
jgi:uncharacterized membrane protein